MFLIVTHLWAIAWWFFVPAWPLGTTYTKGLLGIDQKRSVEAQLVAAQRDRASWMSRIETEPYDTILADETLMRIVRSTGRELFGDNCAACHGRDGRGRANYPDLTDDDWLWGGARADPANDACWRQQPAPESRRGDACSDVTRCSIENRCTASLPTSIRPIQIIRQRGTSQHRGRA
jgi:hypothetical protein